MCCLFVFEAHVVRKVIMLEGGGGRGGGRGRSGKGGEGGGVEVWRVGREPDCHLKPFFAEDIKFHALNDEK